MLNLSKKEAKEIFKTSCLLGFIFSLLYLVIMMLNIKLILLITTDYIGNIILSMITILFMTTSITYLTLSIIKNKKLKK